jgi:hypothetical protein
MIAPELKATVSVVVAAPMSGPMSDNVVASTQVWKDTFGFGLTLGPSTRPKNPPHSQPPLLVETFLCMQGGAL